MGAGPSSTPIKIGLKSITSPDLALSPSSELTTISLSSSSPEHNPIELPESGASSVYGDIDTFESPEPGFAAPIPLTAIAPPPSSSTPKSCPTPLPPPPLSSSLSTPSRPGQWSSNYQPSRWSSLVRAPPPPTVSNYDCSSISSLLPVTSSSSSRVRETDEG